MQSLKAKLLHGLLTAVVCILPQLALAQDPPPLAEMWMMVPKAGHAQELNEALKKHMDFRSEQGDPWRWDAYDGGPGPLSEPEPQAIVTLRAVALERVPVLLEAQPEIAERSEQDGLGSIVLRPGLAGDSAHQQWNADQP